jgi:hypothetical protein
MSESGPDSEEPAEHRRFYGYLQALGQVRDADETALVTRVLATPLAALIAGQLPAEPVPLGL